MPIHCALACAQVLSAARGPVDISYNPQLTTIAGSFPALTAIYGYLALIQDGLISLNAAFPVPFCALRRFLNPHFHGHDIVVIVTVLQLSCCWWSCRRCST